MVESVAQLKASIALGQAELKTDWAVCLLMVRVGVRVGVVVEVSVRVRGRVSDRWSQC